ncbi:hypothetical protein ABEB36_013203 [Hypothenemus hampei]|uniref:Peptidase S1 domain-containing protein n=1 Tax=Hypothenemus hampei TaxID=57062 RepID=A0ABD1E803_HYPHA
MISKKFFLLAFITTVVNGTAELHFNLLKGRRSPRIIGGTNAFIEDHPYMASLHHFHLHICGASIISERWLLTTAICTTLDLRFPNTAIRAFTVRIGTQTIESGGQQIAVLRVYDHPLFLVSPPEGFDYDFSLLYLERNIEFSNSIQPIRLPESNEVYAPGTIATVLGWGVDSEWAYDYQEHLQKVEVPIINNTDCEELYNEFYITGYITARVICAGYRTAIGDRCYGDWGGPLVQNDTLIGLVSWIYICDPSLTPSVYSNVQSVRDWIREVTEV